MTESGNWRRGSKYPSRVEETQDCTSPVEEVPTAEPAAQAIPAVYLSVAPEEVAAAIGHRREGRADEGALLVAGRATC